MKTSTLQSPKEVREQILITKVSEPHNYPKIRKLQQLLDKLSNNK